MTQNKRILRHLQAGHSISPLEALMQFGSLRLGARIFELRHQGHNISMKLSDGKKKFAIYKLKM